MTFTPIIAILTPWKYPGNTLEIHLKYLKGGDTIGDPLGVTPANNGCLMLAEYIDTSVRQGRICVYRSLATRSKKCHTDLWKMVYIAGLVHDVWRLVTEYNVWCMILKYCVWCLISKHYVWLASGGRQTQCFEILRQTPDFKKLHPAGVWHASEGRLADVRRNVSKSGVRSKISKSSAWCLISKHCVWLVSAGRLAGVWWASGGSLTQYFEITRQAQCCKIRRETQHFKIFRQTQFSVTMYHDPQDNYSRIIVTWNDLSMVLVQ